MWHAFDHVQNRGSACSGTGLRDRAVAPAADSPARVYAFVAISAKVIPLRRRADDLDAAVDDLEVVRRCLEHVRDDRDHPTPDLLRRPGPPRYRRSPRCGSRRCRGRSVPSRCRPGSTRTCAISSPSSSATTCAMVVSRLWPWLAALVNTSAWPFWLMRTVAPSVVIQPNAIADGSGNRLTPIPTRRPSARHARCCSRSCVVPDHLRGLLEVGGRGHLVEHHPARHRVRDVLLVDHVATPQLQRVDPEVRREAVDHLLARDRLDTSTDRGSRPGPACSCGRSARTPRTREPVRTGEHHGARASPRSPSPPGTRRRSRGTRPWRRAACRPRRRRRSRSPGPRGRAGRTSGSRGDPGSTSPGAPSSVRREHDRDLLLRRGTS